ncbi:MAG: hypothetical protein JNJ58_03115 [Chitinophagaceae bacterium]|nr:hypothetical protein [Chitinophagaceae bacterium]
MLEIIILFFLTKKIGATAIRKGLKPGIWKLYTVLAWFGGEIIGFVVGLNLFKDNLLMSVLLAIPCAVGGYHIIKNTLEKKPDYISDDIHQIGDDLV